MAPELAVADGALGFWKALGEVWPTDARAALLGAQDRQRAQQAAEEPAAEGQARAAGDLDGRDQEGCARGRSMPSSRPTGVKYDKAVDCLTKDRDALLAFYDFPAEHWKHLRTTNPIESTFATVRHRTIRSKGCLSNKTALAMVFKLAEAAEKSWRRLDGHNQLPKLILGVKFTDGIEVVSIASSNRCRLTPPVTKNSAIALANVGFGCCVAVHSTAHRHICARLRASGTTPTSGILRTGLGSCGNYVDLSDLSAIGPMAAAGTRTAGRQSLLQSPTKLRRDLSPSMSGLG